MIFFKYFLRLFVLAVMIGTAIAVHSQYQRYSHEVAIFADLQKEIVAAELLNQQLQHQLAHHLSDTYVEIAAREMGLVHQREILFIPIN